MRSTSTSTPLAPLEALAEAPRAFRSLHRRAWGLVTCALLLALLHRRLGGVHLRWIGDGLARVVVASAVSALIGWTVWAVLDEAFGRTLLAQIIVMVHATGFAALTYLATAKVLGLEELSRLGGLLAPRA